jgi:lysophospholipase L1-like esterase
MTMRRVLLLSLVLVLTLAVIPSAGADDPDGVYLSMGDSVAAGTSPMAPVTDRAYPDVLFARVADDLGLGSHVDISCPGEDSGELIDGDGSYCYTTAMSQLDYALSIIAADPGAIRLITINIGANDVLGCTQDPNMEACIGAALPELAGNLQHILMQLRTATAGYDVPIVGMNYYNPLMAYQLSPDPGEQFIAAASSDLVTALNDATLAAVYGAFGVPVADVERKFMTDNTAGRQYPRNLRYVCRYTFMCERDGRDLVLSDWKPDPGAQPDIHPTPRGHRKIAAAFTKVMESAGILDD